MEEIQLVLNEIRGVRSDVQEVSKNVSAMEATINGELGVINRMKEHEKQTGDLIKEIHTRLSSIENYIIKQKVYVGIIAALGGIFSAIATKLIMYAFKL